MGRGKGNLEKKITGGGVSQGGGGEKMTGSNLGVWDLKLTGVPMGVSLGRNCRLGVRGI